MSWLHAPHLGAAVPASIISSSVAVVVAAQQALGPCCLEGRRPVDHPAISSVQIKSLGRRPQNGWLPLTSVKINEGWAGGEVGRVGASRLGRRRAAAPGATRSDDGRDL